MHVVFFLVFASLIVWNQNLFWIAFLSVYSNCTFLGEPYIFVTYVYVYIRICVYIHTRVCMYVVFWYLKNLIIYIYTHVYIHIHNLLLFIHTHIHIHTCVCVCVCSILNLQRFEVIKISCWGFPENSVSVKRVYLRKAQLWSLLSVQIIGSEKGPSFTAPILGPWKQRPRASLKPPNPRPGSFVKG